MKKSPLAIFLLSFLFFFGCAKDDNNTEKELEVLPPLMPEMEFSGIESKAIGYIKTISLPKLIQKAVSVAQAVKPGPQVAMLPAMAGLALGDPALTSVDQDAPVTAFVFDDFSLGGLPSFVLAMKLSPESPVIKQAENMSMQTMEVDGWTLATMNPQLFKEVEDWSSLLSFAKESPEEDIELVISMNVFWENLPKMKESALEAIEFSTLSSGLKIDAGQIVAVLLDELATTEATKIELMLSEAEIGFRSTLSAKTETALFTFLSSKREHHSMEASKYISRDGWMDMLISFNADSMSIYFNHLFSLLKESVKNEEWKNGFSKFITLMDNSIQLYGGQVATSYRNSAKGKNPISFVQVGEVKGSVEEFNNVMNEWVVLLKDMFSIIDPGNDFNINYEINLTEDSEIDGSQVYRFGMKMNANDSELDTLLSSYTDTTSYYMVRDGFYFMTSSKRDLKELYNSFKNKKPIEGNLASEMTLEPGQFMSWRLNLAGYAEMVMSIINFGGVNIMGETIEGLKELKIPPVTGSAYLGGGRVSTEIRIPLESIKAGVDYFESMKPIESEIDEDIPEVEGE
ncbi:MAG: hypothetical protein HN553_11320 [Opitutae bacterium]|nr:hypothetical protein [Opitutae bacterium]